MIIEFCAPPGSGKTAVATQLYTMGYYSFRVSSKSRWQRVAFLFLMLSIQFIKIFSKNILFLRRALPELTLGRVMVLSVQGAMTFVLSSRDDIYIKDQGFFQFGDWVRKSEEQNVNNICFTLIGMHGQPDVVVFFNFPEKLSIERMRKRGDLAVWEERAKKKGYKSVSDRLRFQNSQLWVKYNVCEKLKIPYIVVDIDDKSNIVRVSHNHHPGNNTFSYSKMHSLECDLRKVWESDL